jgi:Hemerythrin HHE cation binding domain
MDRQDIARQTQIEQDMLKHIMEGLRISAGWPVLGPDASRKLSSLRFVAQSFQRHLEHLLALEEHDGYMDLVLRCAPHLGRATDVLKDEHEQFRSEARRLVLRLERLPATDLAALDKVCSDLLVVLGKIEEHNAKEIALLQEALDRDEGGEG